VEKGKSQSRTIYQDTDFGHEIRDAVRDQSKASKLEVAPEATYGPAFVEYLAFVQTP